MGLPEILDKEILTELEKKKEIIYFNYQGGNVERLSHISKKVLLRILEGDSHALVNEDLYIKVLGSEDFGIQIKYFGKTREGEFYKEILRGQ